MSRLYERLMPRSGARSVGMSSFQDWVDLFTFQGNNYPILNTSYGTMTEEQVVEQFRDAYKTNGPVFALILARLQVFSQIRFQFTRFEKGHATDLFGGADLALLERPWPNGTTADLLSRMEIDASRAGNAFIRRGNRRLHRLFPKYVTVIMGSQYDAEHPAEAPDTELVGFHHTPPNGKPSFWLPNEVAHYAPIPDPDNHFVGMSWISTVLNDVYGDDLTAVHKRKFFQNAATPNLAIKFDPNITIGQVKEFKALMEEEHRGVWNAYKTLYLGGGADPTVIGQNMQQLEFAATQGKGESRLASAAGVPPSWVGFSEGLQGSALNAGNFGAAKRRFGDGTMHHLWANAAASLESIIRKPDSGASLWFSTAGVPFMREDAKDASEIQSTEAATITGLVREGFKWESVIAAVQNQDWSLLEHSGLLSVQLQPPLDENQQGQQTQAKPPAVEAEAEQEGSANE